MDYATLKNLFRDRDKMIRLFCLKTALKEKLPQIGEFVMEGLRDERPEIVAAALKGARLSDDPEITGMVITYLESPNTLLRSEALQALEGKTHPMVRQAIGEFLRREEDANLLATGVKIVGSFCQVEYIPVLRAFLTFEDERVRANAVESLGQIKSPEVIDLLKALVSDRNNRVRANAIKGLWDRGVRFGLNTLPEELRSPNPRKRASVAYILGEIKDERSIELLVGLLGDLSPTVRNRAVISLGRIGSSRVISQLLTAYGKEDDPPIRDRIIATCMELNADLTISRLLERYTNTEDHRFRANLIRSLALTGNGKGLELYTRALKDDDSRVRANAIEGIGGLKDAALMEMLLPYLNDVNNRVRSNAATALWRLGGMGAVVTLRQMLRSSHKLMRSSAAWALGEIGALQFSDVLQDLANDADPDVRKCALKALAKVSKIA